MAMRTVMTSPRFASLGTCIRATMAFSGGVETRGLGNDDGSGGRLERAVGHRRDDQDVLLAVEPHARRDLGAAVHAKTGGNPLFVADLARYLGDRGVVVRVEERWTLARPIPDAVSEMPESVRGLIRRKLDQLDPADRRLLGACSAQVSLIRGATCESGSCILRFMW